MILIANSTTSAVLCPTKKTSMQVISLVRRPIMVHADNSGTSMEINEVVKDLSDRWDKVEDKTSVILYGSGSVVLLWLASTVVGAIGSIPLLPKLMELVGL